MEAQKNVFLCRSLLLSTTVLNDTCIITHKVCNTERNDIPSSHYSIMLMYSQTVMF